MLAYSYFFLIQLVNSSTFAQLDIAQVIFITEFGDLYFFAYWSNRSIEGTIISYFWNYSQKLMYPNSFIMHILTREFYWISLMEGYYSRTYFAFLCGSFAPVKL